MTAETLLELAERCEKADGPERELDALIYAEQLGGGEWRDNVLHVPSMRMRIGAIDPGVASRNFTCWFEQTPAYTASLDAAMTLVETWHPTFPVNVTMATAYGTAHVMPVDGQSTGVNDPRGGHARLGRYAPALALCAAALRARAAQAGEAGTAETSTKIEGSVHEHAVAEGHAPK